MKANLSALTSLAQTYIDKGKFLAPVPVEVTLAKGAKWLGRTRFEGGRLHIELRSVLQDDPEEFAVTFWHELAHALKHVSRKPGKTMHLPVTLPRGAARYAEGERWAGLEEKIEQLIDTYVDGYRVIVDQREAEAQAIGAALRGAYETQIGDFKQLAFEDWAPEPVKAVAPGWSELHRGQDYDRHAYRQVELPWHLAGSWVA